MKRTALLIGVAALVSSAALKAEVYSIKLGGNAQPACWSLEEIVARVTRGIDSDREKVMALHRFGMAHQIHFIGPYEGGLDLQDALKLLSVYGYNLCGNNSSTMCALYNLAGLKARRRGCTGHVVPEIWFDGKWNYVDTDMFGYVYLPDDKAIASVDELVANPHLFERSGRRPDPFYPWDPPTTMMNAFIKVQGWKDYHPYSLAHLMELSLRTGESVTCWFRPQGRTRYYLDPESFPAEVTTVYRDYWTDGPVRQNSMAWTDTVPAAYGNGQFVYKPDLRSRAFQSENPGIEGVKTAVDQDKPPLVAETAGRTATVVIDVNSPWVICGLQNDLTNWEDNTEGAVVSGWFWRIGEADENRIYVSADGGRNWKLAWENRYLGAIPFRVDLSRYVQGNYSYQVKFEWTDRAGSGRVGLQGLEAETWVELSPMALPRLVPGKNRFEISTGNQRAVINECYWRDGESLPGQREDHVRVQDGDPRIYQEADSIPGVIEFGPGAEGVIDEVRLAFLALPAPGKQIKDIRLTLSVSENGGSSWQKLETFTPNPEQELSGSWFNHIIRGRSLAGKTTRFRLELEGCGLQAVIDNCLERTSPHVQTTLNITHTYREPDGRRQNVNWKFPPGAQNAAYDVDVMGDKIYNESITFSGTSPE
ncbi:MAG TPA: hypothetical protein VJ417_00210 [Candidatus Glassbacteria bacterium]|nr:hypothetical protein [Candidatus Glassbacteria bacterium]